MRIGVIGLGSMGKRRVRDLQALGHEVIGLDERADRRAEAQERFGIRAAADFGELVRGGLDAATVSTPPDRHLEFYEKCFGARIPFFSEASVLSPRPEWFREREAKSGVVSYPSGTWQFHPLFGLLREQLDAIGRDSVNTAHYHYGGYLPLWHPWEEYDAYYAGARRCVSAAREMVPFELEWMRWVFGPVRAVCASHGRAGTWRTDIDDTYLLLLEFSSGLQASLLIELHQVAPFRIGRIACRESSLTLDMAAHELRRYDRGSDTWRILKPPGLRSLGSFDFEQIYMAEIRAFCASLQGGPAFPKTWSDERHLSDVLFAAERSWRLKKWIEVSEVENAYDGLACEVWG